MKSEAAPDMERATSLLKAGNGPEAEAEAMRLVAVDPPSARAWFIIGVARHLQKRPEAALDAMQRAVHLDEGLDEARQACATLLLGLKRPRAALAHIEVLASRKPSDAKAAVDSGIVLEELGDAQAALERYEDGLRRAPNDFRARLNLAALLARLGRLEEALRGNQMLARAYVGSAAAHYNLADVLLRLDRYAEAMAAAERALKLAPDDVKILMLRGVILAMLGRDADARASFAHAGRVDAVAAQNVRAVAASAAGVAVPEKLTLDPRQIRLARLLERQKVCDWRERDRLVSGLRSLTEDIRSAPTPLEESGLYHTALSLPLKASEQWAVAHGLALAAQARAEPGPASSHAMRGEPRKSSAGKKIRIGFLSPNFREHPSAQLHWRHFALRDRRCFEVFAYSLHRSEGALRNRIIESCDVFRELSDLTSREMAARIILDDIDILVDIAGHKDYSRPEVLALRPAPLQVSYLGLPGPMGIELVDYRISDAHATPSEANESWSEKLVLLPGTVWIYNDLEEIAEAVPTRAECGLPERGFVFCCFNTPYKIEPDAFAAWMRLLACIPGSVLWLLDGGDATKENLRREAKVRGVNPERLVFAPRIPRAEHLARHFCADLFLDTFYYGAHTTAADALWAGLPVLTCPGETMSSRIGASIVYAAGLPELVAPDQTAYEAMALHLATRPGELAELRARLRSQRRTCSLFDTACRVRELDRAFAMMWQFHLEGLPPRSFTVPREERSI